MSDRHNFRFMEVTVAVNESDVIAGIMMPVQCHSGVLKEVMDSMSDCSACDGLITRNPELTLGVHTRDCAPICFSDGEKISVAHVGWSGLCKGMIEAVMENFDSSVTEVYVGPHLHVFEIQKDFCYDAITAKFGDTFLLSRQDGMLIFHFKDAIASLLPQYVVFDSRNTMTDTLLPSHRHKRALGHIITTVNSKTV